MYHFQMSGGVSEGSEEAVLQVTEAGKQERALTDDLMPVLFGIKLRQVKQLMKTAVVREYARWCGRTAA